ncbi:MAG: LacI family DNA-binding transcriptional regulator [Acetobacteraceae bacterium]
MARRAGVSTATVSRALNRPTMVSAVLRARITSAVAELRYQPYIAARVLCRLAGGTPPHATRIGIRLVARASTGPPVAKGAAAEGPREEGIDSVP